jgi:hypothetical protein
MMDTRNETRRYSKRAEKVFESRGLQGRDLLVDEIKQKAAVLYDRLEEIPIPPGNGEAGRLVSLAKTELESAVMWAVKAISRSGDPEPQEVPRHAS